jgi:hypothetical protein
VEVIKIMFAEMNDDNNKIAAEIYEKWDKFQRKMHS